MKVSLITYNVLFSKADKYIASLLAEYKPDIISFQEIDTREQNLKLIEKDDYKLADFSNSFIRHETVFGLATYYNSKKYTLVNSESFDLPRSYYELLMLLLKGVYNPRTVLRNEFMNNETGKKFTLYNLHLSPWALNGARLKQIKETLYDFHLNAEKSTIILGDFNYSYRRKSFESAIEEYGLKEATTNIFYTLEHRILGLFPLRMKLDYILYRNCEPLKTERLTHRESDHFPIYAEFEL